MQILCPVHADGPALAGIEPEHIIRHAECLRRVHAAMAARPDQILAKPGMGVDEGFMIVYNEMNRIIALRKAKMGRKS